jgi:FkbM family methyltransferase
MSFISYASNNLEDVMLYRALKHVKRGFYIDIGAGHPIDGSITKAFYDRGWRGINIEPVTEFFELLQQHRPEDINLNLAVGNHQGEVIFYEVVNIAGLSTTNKTYAGRHAEAGYKIRTHAILCTTLDSVCSENNVGTVHILKIDIEGGEKALLEGFAFATVRPWVVVIESVEPNTTIDVSHEWEPLILGRNYKFVYSDGVNRFYLAVEHSGLQSNFCYPPNGFDNYIIYPYWLALHDLSEERVKVTQIHSLESQIQQIQHSIPMQLADRHQRIVERLLRSGTRRRRCYELMLSGIRVILSEGWKSFFRRAKMRLSGERERPSRQQ